MEIVADLHLHSKYSRAVSPNMTLPVMRQNAIQKGIHLMTAADWTHPVWFKEITSQLEEAGEGVYKLKVHSEKLKVHEGIEPFFLLSTELSSIYKQDGKLRRIHSLVFVPDIATAEKVTNALLKRGCNLSADGRPIVGLSAKALLELILSIDERCMLIPCHAWTPHFGVYGSASGFDSLEQAFGDLADHIYGIETGLSSDPDMNWQIPELQHRSILSFSDAHSAPKMAREATVFELEAVTYENIRQAIMQPMLSSSLRDHEVAKQSISKKKIAAPSATPRNDGNRILYTIEFYPEEGKYHFSGHRNCKISYGPEEIQEKGNICPACQRKMTEGVLYRVQQLAEKLDIETAVKKPNSLGLQWFTDPERHHPPYVKLVPLLEIVAESIGSTVSSQKSQQIYISLCEQLTSELHVILRASLSDIEKVAGERVAKGVEKVRAGNIIIAPGYDGEYGRVEIWEESLPGKGPGSTTTKISDAQMKMEW